jgi:3-hydroxyisobutyrate dehydrogenase-like beta-hydroxyacid dehydrogenase
MMNSGGVAGAKKGTLTFMVGAAGDQFTALEVSLMIQNISYISL